MIIFNQTFQVAKLVVNDETRAVGAELVSVTFGALHPCIWTDNGEDGISLRTPANYRLSLGVMVKVGETLVTIREIGESTSEYNQYAAKS